MTIMMCDITKYFLPFLFTILSKFSRYWQFGMER